MNQGLGGGSQERVRARRGEARARREREQQKVFAHAGIDGAALIRNWGNFAVPLLFADFSTVTHDTVAQLFGSLAERLLESQRLKSKDLKNVFPARLSSGFDH